MTENQKKKHSQDRDLQWVRTLALVDTDFKITVIHTVEKLDDNLETSSGNLERENNWMDIRNGKIVTR